MVLKKLVSLGTYEDINGGAHRTAASIVGIPALVRNLGLWDMGARQPEQAGDSRPARADRKALYCEYIRNLRELIDRGGPHIVAQSKCPPLVPDDRPDSDAATLLRFWWHGMLTTIRLEYHSEYITLTSIIDLHVDESKQCVGKVPDCPRFHVTARMRAFNQLFERRRKGGRFEHKAISDYLQLGVWEMFEHQVLDAPRDEATILGDKLGEVFLDSRGIVTGTESFKPIGTAAAHRLRRIFAYSGRRHRMRTSMKHEAPDPRWAHDSVRRMWPFIESQPELADYEFTVTGFLEGRVLFVTALGPQPAAGAAVPPAARPHDKVGTPIRYFLHAHPDDEWELGRLVDRINALGTMRLAATMQIGKLREAGEHLDELYRTITGAITIVQGAIKEKEGGTGAASVGPLKKVDAATPQIESIGKSYAKINGPFGGDIWRRLERSQYYIEQFRKECGALREARVEGFQTYSEFVTRRMSGIFGYVQYLRTRMESIDSANSSLERQYSWLKVASVTGEIKHVVDAMKNQDSEIEKIQEFGEFALIGALLPYYVGTCLMYILSWQGLGKMLFWVFIIVLCSCIALYRLGRKKSDMREAFAAKRDAGVAGYGLPEFSAATLHLRVVWWIFVSYMGLAVLALAFALATGRHSPPPAAVQANSPGGVEEQQADH